jgi:dienelactone hydrolase
MKLNRIARIAVSFVLLLSSPLIAKTYDITIPPGEKFDIAQFRLWLDDSTIKVRGILLLTPGSNTDGREDVDDQEWQDFARQHDFAVVAAYWTDSPHEAMMIEEYADVSNGPGEALIQALNEFSKIAGHQALAAAPLLLWGHSAGGEYNYEFALWKPERVIAFVVNKGNFYYNAVASAKARQVPGLFFTAENDLTYRNDAVQGIFSMNRRPGALWALAHEPGAGHEVGMTKKMALTFFREILPLRLEGTAQSNSGATTLNALVESSGSLGIYDTLEVLPVTDELKKEPTAWLATEAIATAWRAFSAGEDW